MAAYLYSSMACSFESPPSAKNEVKVDINDDLSFFYAFCSKV